MNDDLFINGMGALGQNWKLILEILVFVSWGTLLIFAILKKAAKQDYGNTELTALALGGWPVPALLVSLLILGLLPFVPTGYILIFILILISTSAGFAIHVTKKDFTPGIIPPLLFFLFLLFLRLGFITKAVLPSYFDSAEHYRIVQLLLNMNADKDFTWPATSYYHLGYHSIVAAFSSITYSDPVQVMLIFGQVILAAIPLPIYFFVRRVTGSSMAAILGVTLAAFGWYMPAHAVNWGKYPALLSLLVIQFTLGAMALKKRWLIVLGIIASTLIHTRAIILFGILGAAWLLSKQIRSRRTLFLALTGATLVVTILLINQNQILGPVFEPYEIWVTLLVGLLSALTFQSFPQLTIFTSLAMLMLLAGIFVPVTSSITLLDRPLVEMILFAPLAFFGGLGAARIPKFIVPVLVAGIVFHAWMTYDFYPSACCQLADRNDMAAMDWINEHLPVDAHFAVASSDLVLNSSGTPMQSTGTDAGIWIEPLTGRISTPISYFTDFSAQSTHDFLCNQQVKYIYDSGMPQGFIFTETKMEWYETIFSASNIEIIQVNGCGDG